LGFHPVAVFLTRHTTGKDNNIHKEKQYRSQNTQNINQKVENNKPKIKRIIKTYINSSITKDE
jgi:hypothetical protein